MGMKKEPRRKKIAYLFVLKNMFFPLGSIKCLDFEKKKELLVHLNICPIEKKCCFFCKYFRKKTCLYIYKCTN